MWPASLLAAMRCGKPAESAATFDLHSLPKGILIIRGESGWTGKIPPDFYFPRLENQSFSSNFVRK
ncbi:MAG: hypothetical protein LBL04_10075 [Bacteroidales bacterium]|nr:hypothetical protein [Bacteroidales bacterium]